MGASPGASNAMNERRITLEELAEAKPLCPACHDEDFSAHEARTLACLREAGQRGYSNEELRDRGCGERPSNRVCALRKKGHLIKTDRSSYPARFVLLGEADGSESAKRVNRHDNARWFEEHFGVPKQPAKSVAVVGDDALPLFKVPA